VRGLYVARAAGSPIELRAEAGVVGDRYAAGAGFWSDPRWPDQELTLVETEVAAGIGIAAGELRRNIATEGVRLETLIGSSFEVGETRLLGVRRCDPCLHLESLTRAGIAGELAERGGLRARIIRGGLVRLGDSIRIVENTTT
jgi:MOSC domain-containing protein YiiM